MQEARGDLWTYEPADVRVITTNGSLKRNGELVMGRGCAQEAAQRFPGLALRLGRDVSRWGNVPILIHWPLPDGEAVLLTMPVKDHWRSPASLDLIERSATRIAHGVDTTDYQHIVVPRPGCGAGQLKWADVRPVLSRLWDDRFTVITF